MKQNIPLGRIAGIAIGASWTALVTLAIFADLLATSALPSVVPRQPPAVYWGVGAAGAVALLVSLLAHELAHALVARRHGIKVRSVTLWMLGGLTELDGDPGSPAADLRVALAGPAASLVAGAVFLGAAAATADAGGPPIAVAAMFWLALMNGVLAVFNLLPGAPLDGGRVLRGILWHYWGSRSRAERGAASAGRALGWGLAALGVVEFLLTGDIVGGLWLVLLGWFMVSSATAEQNAASARDLLAGVRMGDIMIANPELAASWMSVADFARLHRSWPPQPAFPVLGPDGRLAGVVTAIRLARIPADRQPHVRMSQLVTPVPAEYRAGPDDPAAPLLTRQPLDGEVLAVVKAGGRVVGLVTAEAIQQALRCRAPAAQAGQWTAEVTGAPDRESRLPA
jgi:Zn-dependent protease/CBS domain-containing protein